MSTHSLPIARHRTAMKRTSVSRPLARVLADGLITAETTVLDYGCGLGADVTLLQSRGIRAEGWDPYYRPNARRVESDVVNLGYVLNVIEDPAERLKALRQAFSFAKRLLVVSVRTDQVLEEADEFGDGVRTSWGTFQKVYTPQEFRDYLSGTLGQIALLVAPGIAYLFKDDQLKSWYLANRVFTRRLEYRIDLLEAFASDRLAKRYVAMATRLGRLPLAEEFSSYARLLDRFGPLRRLERLVLRAVRREVYDGSRAERRTDILTYLAMVRLEGLRQPPFQALPVSIQADVRALWGSYSAAALDAERVLFSIGDPAVVRAAATEARVGKLLPEDLYVHRTAVDELPALLRLISFAATRIVGEVPYDVMKISLHGRSVSFLQYPAFDTDAHPALLRSIRVYLPRASHTVREFDPNRNPPILHRKEALVLPNHPRYGLFHGLTAQEEVLGLLSAPDIGHQLQWEALLAHRGLIVKGHEVLAVSRVL